MLGPSGCGKTTLLRIISGLETPDSGDVFFDSDRVTSLPPHQRGIGMVFQNYALWPHMTVEETLSFGLEIKKLPKALRKERTEEALAMVSLLGLESRYPHELSGGQQQRVALARALALQPRLLLLDEPLSNLDAELKGEIREQIRAIHKRLGITMIFVSHDPEDVRSLAHRAAILRNGTILNVGTPDEVLTSNA